MSERISYSLFGGRESPKVYPTMVIFSSTAEHF
jgi:hypothetical protein